MIGVMISNTSIRRLSNQVSFLCILAERECARAVLAHKDGERHPDMWSEAIGAVERAVSLAVVLSEVSAEFHGSVCVEREISVSAKALFTAIYIIWPFAEEDLRHMFYRV